MGPLRTYGLAAAARSRFAQDATKWQVFRDSALHDVLPAGGFLVVGGLVAATLNVVVPESVIESVADRLWLSVLVLAGLAVIVAICSEADAFVAGVTRRPGPLPGQARWA